MADPRARDDKSVSLYLQVARALQERIAAGAYPVGALLPTEHALAGAFGVSRQTIRQAIGHLRAMKLLSATRGVGTRVDQTQPRTAYYHALQSLPDLFQFASDALYHVHHAERVTVIGREAEELGCRPGRAWLRLIGVRVIPGVPGPLCQTSVMIDGRYADAIGDQRILTRAIFALIEDRFGIAVTEVHQEIEAAVLDEAQAATLHARAGNPALLITRRFLGAGRKLIELSRNLHPADRFRYSMTVRRDGSS